MSRKKFYSKVLIAILACIVGFYVNFNICIRYDGGFNGVTMITIAAVSMVLCGISSFISIDLSKWEVVEGLLLFGLAIATLACGYTSHLTVSYYLIPVFFIVVSIADSVYFFGAAKGSKEADRILAMWGYISLGIADFALFFSIAPIFITLVKNSNEYLSGALKLIPMIILGVGALLALLLVSIHLVKNKPLSNESAGSRSYQSSSSRKSYSGGSSTDYRDKAVGVFYNVLRDNCRSIAREFSSSHSLTHGRARFEVSTNVGNSDITYTINVSVSPTAQNQYEMNDLQDSLKDRLETVAQNIYNKTETAIDRLREKYQDFDGEYNINVKVGNVR